MHIRRSFLQGALVGGLCSTLGLGIGAIVVALSSGDSTAPAPGKGASAPHSAAAVHVPAQASTSKRNANTYRMACRDCINLVVTEPKSAYPLGPNLLMMSVDALLGGPVVVYIGRESHLLNIGQYADLTFEDGCRLALSRSEKGRADFMFACDQDADDTMTIASATN